jgi:ABC-type multidrug transport system fused ATPase/permease subunit
MLFRASQRFGSDRAASPSPPLGLEVGDLRLQNAVMPLERAEVNAPIRNVAPKVMSRSVPTDVQTGGKTATDVAARAGDYGSIATYPAQGELAGGAAGADELGASRFIEAEGLSVRYGQTQALFDVSLSIPRNRVAAIIGPSGS